MLKYQKAKVKLLEYEVPEDQWPNFQLNYKDLSFITVLYISFYAELINDDKENKVDQKKLLELKNNLLDCSEYYDAALHSREQILHDVDFALTGAAAYFFADDYGSAKVMWRKIDRNKISSNVQRMLYDVFFMVFKGKIQEEHKNLITEAIFAFWNNGDEKSLESVVDKYREGILETNSPQSLFFGEILCALVRIIKRKSARILLPIYSEIYDNSWSSYFKSENAINLFWPSQQLVGISGFLKGKSGVLELPTGVGKTKSIEIIIWSMFLSKRGSTALIVAPLRSLCNEISNDLRIAFPDEVRINQFSDDLENDFNLFFYTSIENKILICTPEKLLYIFYHDCSFLRSIDLFVFDEGHMLDDQSRGCLYELLLTEIKLHIDVKQQVILMSAVLPNSDQIVKWLFEDKGVLAYDDKIKSTPKAVGFSDRNSGIHYYLSAENEEDYYIPFTYKKRKLKLLGREKKARFFPDSPQDIALYYTNILCKSGGVAIYFSQRRSISKFLERIIDISSRDYDLYSIQRKSDLNELNRFRNLFESYYGKNYIFTKTVKYGILPHYSSLPNGLKVSAEYAFKNNKVRAVACTSTLAQGVNIPIKYLLIIGTNISSKRITVRNFQNLIGRAGRSGVYTEGDIIVVSNEIYDERYSNKRGWNRWNYTKALFDPTRVESCGSSILNMLKDYVVSYNVIVCGYDVVKYICDNISNDWEFKLLNYIKEKIKVSNASLVLEPNEIELSACVTFFKETVKSIENEIINYLSEFPDSEHKKVLKPLAVSLISNSFAYFLANDDEKKVLLQLANAISSKIELQLSSISKYYKIMLPISDADKIIEWILSKKINEKELCQTDLIKAVEDLFGELFPALKVQDMFSLSWICGYSYEDMSTQYNIKVNDVEKICQHNLSFQMSFLVGNIIELVSTECVNIDGLLILQKQLKYGVNSKTAISICEQIFNDRFLSTRIATDILHDSEISKEDITLTIIQNRDAVKNFLQNYPSYFEKIVENLKD